MACFFFKAPFDNSKSQLCGSGANQLTVFINSPTCQIVSSLSLSSSVVSTTSSVVASPSASVICTALTPICGYDDGRSYTDFGSITTEQCEKDCAVDANCALALYNGFSNTCFLFANPYEQSLATTCSQGNLQPYINCQSSSHTSSISSSISLSMTTSSTTSSSVAATSSPPPTNPCAAVPGSEGICGYDTTLGGDPYATEFISSCFSCYTDCHADTANCAFALYDPSAGTCQKFSFGFALRAVTNCGAGQTPTEYYVPDNF